MNLKHLIRFALVAAVLLAAFGLTARESKPAFALPASILVNDVGGGNVAVANNATITIKVNYALNPNLGGQYMVAMTGYPWLANGATNGGGATATNLLPWPAGARAQGGCTGNYLQTPVGNPILTQPNAAQTALLGAMTNLRVTAALSTALISGATADVTAQFVPEATIANIAGGAAVAASVVDGCYVSASGFPGIAAGAPYTAAAAVPYTDPFFPVSDVVMLTLTATINCAFVPAAGIGVFAAQPPVTWVTQVSPAPILAPGAAGNPIAVGQLLNWPGTITCTAAPTNSDIRVRKIDQFGNPLSAIFAVQQLAGIIWTDVTRLQTATCAQVVGPGGPPLVPNPNCTLGAPSVNPCPSSNTACAFPAFVNGLPAATYRIIEVSQPNNGNPSCTLVNVWQGPLPASLGGPGGGNETPLPPTPPQITLPLVGLVGGLPAGIVLNEFTFVNSCLQPGAISGTASQVVVVIGGSSQGLTNTANVEVNPAPGSDDDVRIDVRVRDALNIPMIGAHVTFTTDKGRIAVRRAFDTSTFFGVDVIEPNVPLFGTNLAGDSCDYALAQSSLNGIVSSPYINSSPTAQDGFTDGNGIISACGFFGTDLAPGTPPGIATVTIYVEQNGAANFSGFGGLNLASQTAILTAKITVVGPPASITVSASPTSLNCGEKATITVSIKDAANQNVSDHTRFESVTNAGGVLGGTGGTLGFPGVGPANPVSSAAGETFNGTGTLFLLTSTSHTGAYEVVVTSGGSTGGFLQPIITQQLINASPTGTNTVVVSSGGIAALPVNTLVNTTAPQPLGLDNSTFAYAIPQFVTNNVGTYGLGGAPTGVFSTPPVSSQVTVNCSLPVAAAPAVIPVVRAPATGEGPVIRPPNTGDAGLVRLFELD